MCLHLFTPDEAVASVELIDLDELYDRGFRAIIIDLDNTIVAWRSEQITPERLEWLKRAAARFRICILSNTIFGRRLKRIADRLGAERLAVWHIDRKPRRYAFSKALRLLGARPAETIVIGDQLVADILGARRAGLYCIWVTPISKHEFFATKLARLFERLVVKLLRRRGMLPEVRHG